MTVPNTMMAAYVEALGPVETIAYGELPVPAIGPTDVLVAVDATVVNPVDTLVRSGRFATKTPFPFVIGRDLVGRVAAVGEGADHLVGDQVWCNSLGHDGRQGAFAEYAVVSTDRLYRVPHGVDPTRVLAVAHPAGTAYLAWFEHARLQAGETVYVGGAAGNVGRAALAMAKHAGARVIASAHGTDCDRCRDEGADAVIDYSDSDLASRINAEAPNGVDIFWDTSGHQPLSLALATTAIGGRIVVTAAGTGEQRIPTSALYTRDITLHGFVISRASVRELADAASGVNDWVARGVLEARITDELPLSAAAEAHARIEAGSLRGRLIVRP